MSTRLFHVVALATVLTCTTPVPGHAQGRRGAPAPPATPLTRTADGQPDVQGFWGSTAYTQDLETALPDEETNEIQGRGAVDTSKAISRIVDPADGKIPYQPWAADRRIHIPSFRRGETSKGGSHGYRVIPLDDARPHLAEDVKLSMGDARGHWEGTTLVVDTSNINDWDWFDATGTFHSNGMHMVERFGFADSRTMTYDVTITDPAVFTKPWTIRVPFQRLNRPADYEAYQEACVEGTKGVDKIGFSIK